MHPPKSLADKFAWLAQAVAAPGRTLATVATAAALATYFNLGEGAAWPSERAIAEWTRLDRRTVRRALADLHAQALVKTLAPGWPRRSARYT